MFTKLMEKLIAFFEKWEGGNPPSPASPVTRLPEGSQGKEKDSVKGTSSYPDVFCKKSVLKNDAIYTGKYLH